MMSNFDTHNRAIKEGRSYRLGKRALKQEETRRRIVEAAVKLHGTLGPARATVSQIADGAGVQRHTFYAHFPNERSLFLACSGLTVERDPLPQVEQWQTIPPGRARVREGLAQLYSWYQRNEELAASVLRDAEYHDLTREMVELRMKPTFDAAADVLGEGLNGRARELLDVALDFACWRRLSPKHNPDSASALMTDALFCLSAG